MSLNKQRYGILQDVLAPGWDNTQADLSRVGTTPFFYGGLSIVYGRPGSGKSWQTAKLLGPVNSTTEQVIYLDGDGSNGKLKAYCENNGIFYLKLANELLPDIGWKDLTTFNKISVIMNKLTSVYHGTRLVFIVDSLSSISDGLALNNSFEIAPSLYAMNNLADQLGCAFILIDHSTDTRDTKGRVVSFKMEGNESAKLRATTSVVRYDPLDSAVPAKGGTFTAIRSRDHEQLPLQSEFLVNNVDVEADAYRWFAEKVGFDPISRRDLTLRTKNSKDLWLRDYVDSMFTIVDKTQLMYKHLQNDNRTFLTLSSEIE